MNIKIPQCKKIYNSLDTKQQKQIKRQVKQFFQNHNADLAKLSLDNKSKTVLKNSEFVKKSPSVIIVEDVMTIGGYGSINFLL